MPLGSSGFSNPPPWTRSSSSIHSSNVSSHSHQSVGGPTYPIKRPHSPDDHVLSHQTSSSNSKVKTSSGFVTKLYETWGIIDNEIQFSFSACTKGVPKLKDYVTVETIHSPGTTYKWRATKVGKVVPASNGRDYSNLKPVSNSRPDGDYRRPRIVDRSRERRYDEVDKKRFKRDDKDDKIREFDKDGYKEREKVRDYELVSPIRRSKSREKVRDYELVSPIRHSRSREKVRDFERVSPARRSRSPLKRKSIRYSVKVPGDLLTLYDFDIITLKKRYPNLYIPSDFFSSSIRWCETFPTSKPFNLNMPCSFHVMRKDCISYIHNDAILEPPDLDYTFSAKVMLMSVPHFDEIYKRTICLAEDMSKDDDRSYLHITQLIQFLVGSRGKNEPLAIGGPWSPSLDGENPGKNPSVLIKTAIRTCKALTGIDLSVCSQWYRFMEVYYHRSESVYKGKTYPARVETVVFFLPEVWNCVPSCLEWDNVICNYKNLVEDILHPKKIDESAYNSGSGDQAEESDKEEDLVVIDKCEDKIEPTHHSELDPQNMKVNDLHQELEARALSTKGLKQHLIQRLELALRKERDREESDAEKDKIDDDSKFTNTSKISDAVEEDNVSANEEPKETKEDIAEMSFEDVIDVAILEKKYALPGTPHIVVHPSRTAKAGKFDCLTMSLSSLLNFRGIENKEHSFELYLFAKLFNEMLQRDFGFQIYKALCKTPEKAKEDDKDVKNTDKDASKLNSPEKTSKAEEKDKNIAKGDKSEKRLSDSTKTIDETVDNDTKNEEIKKKDKVKLVTKDPFLLLSFAFFDRTHCGYILEKDLESLLFCLGLHLSRHQVKKLISKVTVRETVHYRKLTDKPEKGDDYQPTTINVDNIALGNNKYLPVFTEKSTRTSPSKHDNEFSNRASNDNGLVCIDGAVVDVVKVTVNLKKSESIRLELENQLLKLKKDIDGLRESLKKSSEREKRLNSDYRNCRDKLAAVNKEKLSYSNKSRTYYKLLMNIKDQISSFEEKPEKNAVKSEKSDEKADEKSSAKSKKELPNKSICNDKQEGSDQKNNCSNEATKNSNEKASESETNSSTAEEPNQFEETVT